MSYSFYLPLQLVAGLLLAVIALAESKLCGAPLSLQLILQLRNRRRINYLSASVHYRDWSNTGAGNYQTVSLELKGFCQKG